jgi:hypothetical protein
MDFILIQYLTVHPSQVSGYEHSMRDYAKSSKVTGSIPDVIGFFN